MAVEPNQPGKEDHYRRGLEEPGGGRESGRPAGQQAAPPAGGPAEEAKPAGSEPSPGPHGPLPPATLGFLIGTLYLQGAMALGLLPNPVSGKSDVHLDQAKHAIDLLAVLEAKTAGNRTPDESAELDSALHELRLVYVQRK